MISKALRSSKEKRAWSFPRRCFSTSLRLHAQRVRLEIQRRIGWLDGTQYYKLEQKERERRRTGDVHEFTSMGKTRNTTGRQLLFPLFFETRWLFLWGFFSLLFLLFFSLSSLRSGRRHPLDGSSLFLPSEDIASISNRLVRVSFCATCNLLRSLGSFSQLSVHISPVCQPDHVNIVVNWWIVLVDIYQVLLKNLSFIYFVDIIYYIFYN